MKLFMTGDSGDSIRGGIVENGVAPTFAPQFAAKALQMRQKIAALHRALLDFHRDGFFLHPGLT